MTRRIESQREQWALWRTAIPRQPDRQFLHRMMDAIEGDDWKGITLRDQPGDGPTSGYMVSLPGMERAIPMDELSGASLGDYLDEVNDNPDYVPHPDDHYGGWHENDDDGDLWYNDISRNIGDSYDTARAAVDWKQKAVFDTSKRDPHGNALDSAYVYTGPLVNSGPGSALGWTHAHKRRP